MSVRTSIAKALALKLSDISISSGYSTNLAICKPYLKFWDECHEFSAIYMSTGSETREYLPGGFKWAFLGISLKIYVKGEDPAQELENLLEDVTALRRSHRRDGRGVLKEEDDILKHRLVEMLREEVGSIRIDEMIALILDVLLAGG